MSYWVYLVDPETEGSVRVDNHAEGGTYVLGGTTEAILNVTYNYSAHICEHLSAEGLRWLDGRAAAETTDALRSAVAELGAERDDDYWAETEGNAGHALSVLLRWAEQHPQAIWRVD